MAGWYCPQAMYAAEELGGLPIQRYAEAVSAEIGREVSCGANFALHTHRYFKDYDMIHAGKPTRLLFAERDVRKLDEQLKASENIPCISIPWFVKYMPEYIEQFANGYKKVSAHYRELLDGKTQGEVGGHWYASVN
jgi:hypothetical protein